jgi:predicted amidophosphoribosyltransferase
VAARPHQLAQTWLPLTVGTEYSGIGRTLVLAHKRSLQRTLAAPLGLLLANAVLELHLDAPDLRLIPMPPHRAALHTRGQDTVAAIARQAMVHLRARGLACKTASALHYATDVGSLAGLNRRERMAHMSGAFVAQGGNGLDCVMVDDVITTGATMRAAHAALRGRGWNVLAGSAVAGVR